MKPMAARFLKGLVGADPILDDGTPQIAFIGRSNVGKSSVINSLTGRKGLARTSSFPGRTQQINVFLIEDRFYVLDLPGYGHSRHSLDTKRRLHRLIDWYLFKSAHRPKKVVFIIDAEIGPTENDLEMLEGLDATHKPVLVVANKADKVRPARFPSRLREIRERVGPHKIIPYSSVTKAGRDELAAELFG